MMHRPRRFLAQGIVGGVVMLLLAAGVWFAARAPEPTPRGTETAKAPPATAPSDATEVPEAPTPWDVLEATPTPSFPLTALVPDRATLVVTTSWPALTRTRWGRREEPLRFLLPRGLGFPRAQGQVGGAATTTLLEILRVFGSEVEAFAFEEELLTGEVVLAAGLDLRPSVYSPRLVWNDTLLIARVSPGLSSALARQLAGGHTGKPTGIRVRSVGGGVREVVRESWDTDESGARKTTVWGDPIRHRTTSYLTLHGDVLVFGPEERTVREAAGIARALAAHPERAAWFDDPPPPPTTGLSARLDVTALRDDLQDLLTHEGAPLSLLRRWFPIPTLETLELAVDAGSSDALHARASLRYEPGRLPGSIQWVYAGSPAYTSRVASHVPAADTFALLTVLCPARYAVRSLYEDGLTASDRWDRSMDIRRAGSSLEVRAHVADLIAALGETWAFSLARRRDVQAHRPEDPREPARETLSDALAWALIVELAEGVDENDLGADLLRLGTLLGLAPEVAEHRGRTIAVAGSPVDGIDPYWLPAAWFVAGGHLVISNHRPYLEQFVDVLVDLEGTPALASTPAWRETAAALPEKAHLSLVVALEPLLRAPATADAEGGTGGLFWDWRRLWLPELPDLEWEAELRRTQLEQQYRSATGTAPDMSAGMGIEEDVTRYIEALRRSHSERVEAFHERLAAWQDLRGLGLTVVAAPPVLEIELHVGTE